MEGLLQLTSSCTVLCTMSSHTHLLPHFSDVLIMEGGRMQASGTLADVKQHLSHLTYEAWWLNSSPGLAMKHGLRSINERCLMNYNEFNALTMSRTPPNRVYVLKIFYILQYTL